MQNTRKLLNFPNQRQFASLRRARGRGGNLRFVSSLIETRNLLQEDREGSSNLRNSDLDASSSITAIALLRGEALTDAPLSLVSKFCSRGNFPQTTSSASRSIIGSKMPPYHFCWFDPVLTYIHKGTQKHECFYS